MEKAMRPAKSTETVKHTRRNTAYNSKKSKKGFTLIEILIVLVILSLLVGIVIISVGGVISRGQQTGYEGEDEAIRTAVTAYYVANTEWPTSETTNGVGNAGKPGIIDMSLLTTPSEGELPYLDQIPRSASAFNCPDPDIECTGHYTWSVEPSARVKSACIACPDPSADGYQGVYP